MAWSLREKVRGVNEGERAGRRLPGDGGSGLQVGSGWDVAVSFCAHDTHRRCTSGPSASEPQTVHGWVTWQGKSMCPRLTVVGHVAEPRTVRRIGVDCPPLLKTMD